ncbi:MAG: S-layer homology domain-containing protein, partial [Clostridia bacterium]|nr:S-layer homology domain-containing protein [Clostridia bacterium]
DSFVFTATDPAGNVSRQATVTVQILKSTESRQYADTAGLSCQFEAQWLRNTGLFAGENVGGQDCFFPDKTVSRGDFLAMVTKALDIPLEDSDFAGVPENVPLWLKPYVGAAIRSGLLEGLPEDWQTDGPITGAEVAVMLQNALDLPVAAEVDEALPAWAADSVATMAVSGIALEAEGNLTRARASEVLYQVSILSLTAPGMQILR